MIKREILYVLFLCINSLVFADEIKVRVLILQGQKEIVFQPACAYIAAIFGVDESVILNAGTSFIVNRKKDSIVLRDENSNVLISGESFQLIGTCQQSQLFIQRKSSNTKERAYPGKVEFYLNEQEGINVITEIPMEDYLSGVVPAEIGKSAPLEAMKAQSVLARAKTLLRIQKINGGQNYHFKSDVSFQVYHGADQTTEHSSHAVQSTRGQILIDGDQPLDAFYYSCCGGHTENANLVWSGGTLPYGKPDREGNHFDFDLREEKQAKIWIESTPEAYCHPDQPGIPNWAKKKFRWQRTLTKEEIKKAIGKKKDIGNIIKIHPIERGVSGRIIKLEFIGEKGSLVLTSQSKIRFLFSPALTSSAFTIQPIGNPSLPEGFILNGAGSGHGVGLCQIGTMSMAAQGKTYIEILKHYYPDFQLVKFYE